MKKLIFFLAIFLISGLSDLLSQPKSGTEVYFITCGPGTETYSIYGHCALRIYNRELKTDLVYNWGVFDFSTTHFVWKFAKGKLNYMLAEDSFKSFMQTYFFEKRWMQIQKINLEPAEVEKLMELINENIKPENRNYRYDFYYDNCATRIRDLLEKILGNKLIYPPDVRKDRMSFRNLTGQYQQLKPWLNFGIDLVIGTPGDKKATLRDKMFLPILMQRGLSESLVNRDGKMIPLLCNPENILEYPSPVVKTHFFLSPLFIFSLILIAAILLFAIDHRKKANKAIDILIYSVYSSLSLLMVFFSFITNHEATKKNLNIIWLSPFIFICLIGIILDRKWHIWFKIVSILCIVSFFIQIALPDAFNKAFIPLIILLLFRSTARAGFEWNPFSVAAF